MIEREISKWYDQCYIYKYLYMCIIITLLMICSRKLEINITDWLKMEARSIIKNFVIVFELSYDILLNGYASIL